MAISKKTILNASKPEALYELPLTKCDCHPEHEPKPTCHATFEEAVLTANRIHLKPGEAHAEFYKVGNDYHCVLAIGNINDGKPHLLLTDDGKVAPVYKDSEKTPTADQIKDLQKLICEILKKISGEGADLTKLEKAIKDEADRAKAAELLLNNEIVELTSKVSKNSQDITSLNNKVSQIEGRLEDLDVYTEITDSSIESLFKDIYTINLCCISEGGHIELPSEYTTYYGNETVKIKAVANEGYVVTEWLKDGRHFSNEPEINVAFNNNDINVIGTLNDGYEREPLQNGYTAVFAKLITIDITINNITPVQEVFGDSVEVEGSIENAYATKGANLTIKCTAVEHHKFISLSVNGKLVDNNYVLNNVLEDVVIVATFEEVRYTLTLDEYPDNSGAVYGGCIELEGKECIISAVPEEGYKFINWTYNTPEGAEFSKNKVENIILNSNIKLIANFVEK